MVKTSGISDCEDVCMHSPSSGLPGTGPICNQKFLSILVVWNSKVKSLFSTCWHVCCAHYWYAYNCTLHVWCAHLYCAVSSRWMDKARSATVQYSMVQGHTLSDHIFAISAGISLIFVSWHATLIWTCMSPWLTFRCCWKPYWPRRSVQASRPERWRSAIPPHSRGELAGVHRERKHLEIISVDSSLAGDQLFSSCSSPGCRSLV